MTKVFPEFTIDEALYLLSAVRDTADEDPKVKMALSKLELGIYDAACDDPSGLLASHERTRLQTIDFFQDPEKKV